MQICLPLSPRDVRVSLGKPKLLPLSVRACFSVPWTHLHVLAAAILCDPLQGVHEAALILKGFRLRAKLVSNLSMALLP